MNSIVVYTLESELKRDPDQIAQVQSLTLNADRPTMGLKGTRGARVHNDYDAKAHVERIRT